MDKLLFCKPSCAMCCAVTSVCCIIFLVGLGAAYQADLEELVHGPAGTVPVDPAGTATACFIAAGIYVACLGLSSCQLWLRKKTFPHGEGDMQ